MKSYGKGKKMKMSIYDVAKKAGVSVVTVSRVLNNVPSVRQSSREKVEKAIDELNYIPNAAARSLAKGKTNVIGLMLPNLSDSFLSEVVRFVDSELMKRNYSLAITILDENPEILNEKTHLFFQQERVDGVMMLTPLYENECMDLLENKKIPYVTLDNQRYPFRGKSVVVDNFKGGYEATRYLIERGHRKIAHVTGDLKLLSASERFMGFEKALEEVGMESFDVVEGSFQVEAGRVAVEKWMKEKVLPDAIFAADDLIAFGIINTLNAHGLSVPQDVSLIGFDDHPFCSQLKPYLTTMRQPAEEMAKAGVDTLLDSIEKKVKCNKVIKLEPKLICRETVLERD